MQTIIPHLWFDTQAVEAAKYYVSLFAHSKINTISKLYDTPSGEVDTVDFTLDGVRLNAISAGPYFTLNPSISLMVTCRSADEVDRLYEGLKDGATVLMPLGEYPFSKRYVWLADRFGLNWQLCYFETDEIQQKIRPVFLFAGEACGKAEDALAFYSSVFADAKTGYVSHYQPGEAMIECAKVNYAELTLGGFQLVAMDHGAGGTEAFNEAFSLMVLCKDQAEIDYYWEKLSAVPEAEQCGWLKDKFGVSWQIVPEQLGRMLETANAEEAKLLTKAFLGMKKLDIAALEQARRG